MRADAGRLAEHDYLTYVDSYRDTPKVRIVDEGDVRYRSAEDPHPFLNLVYGARFAPADADRRLREVIDTHDGEGRAFYWTVWPSDGPDDLAARLVAAGLTDLGAGPLMAAPLTEDLDPGAPVKGLTITRAADPEAAGELARFAIGSMEDDGPIGPAFSATLVRLATEREPRLRLFGGWVDGRLVATSGLFTGAGVAGVIAVATAEPMRGRGIGRAMTAIAANAGRALGFELTTLMATDLGEPVYRRLGYAEVGRVRFLLWPGEGRTPAG